jgi:hypothetical protein
MPQSSVWHILRKRLRLKLYRLQLLQALNPQDHNLRFQFCVDFQQRLEEDGFAEKLVFSDEATFHVCGKVNRHNVRIWSTENPHATVEHVRDSPMNVFFAVPLAKSTDHSSLRSQLLPVSTTWTWLQLWLIPELQEDSVGDRWIWRASDNDSPLLPWPPRSPDLTHCDFFLGLHQGSCVRAPYAT